MVRLVVMIICWLLFLPEDIFCMLCNTHSRIHTTSSENKAKERKRERDNFKEMSKRVGFGHFSSQMHDCEKENAS